MTETNDRQVGDGRNDRPEPAAGVRYLEITQEMVEILKDWSPPVQLKLDRDDGRFVEAVVRRYDPGLNGRECQKLERLQRWVRDMLSAEGEIGDHREQYEAVLSTLPDGHAYWVKVYVLGLQHTIKVERLLRGRLNVTAQLLDTWVRDNSYLVPPDQLTRLTDALQTLDEVRGLMPDDLNSGGDDADDVRAADAAG